ncbi:MAG: T9SS type A sorting domain-containing protein [Bacteroides sp.]|nr:T9SS type A sorting domain-containing protein [Bacteroides sp.]
MKKFTCLMLICLLGILTAQAQESKPGVPPSFSWPSERQELTFETMAPVNAAKLLEEDLIFDTIKDIPWRFGTPIYTDMSLDNSGSWYVYENGDRVWRLGIKSAGAYALTLIFDRYILPEGTELYVYNTDRSRVTGAFTDYNNQDDHYFATTLIEGDELIVEYFEPHGVAFPGELKIESVNHAYRDPLTYVKAFGQSGWCNLNVACPESEGWEEQIRSVALMLVSGSAWCTGALINNTSNDGTPLMLTANHCYQNPGSLVFWFNWQSATCANPPTPPPYDAVGNLVHRARNSASDFWLLEFSNPIPESVNPFFSGWNRDLSSTIDETIIGIHHPSGDIKKFSYAEGGVQASSYLGSPGSGTTHWRITWSGGTTTEGGSSGSPIFDAGGRIIGQLHGGYAACGNTQPDWYGRLGVSWTGGGSATTRLSDWLDPLGTNATAIDGYDPFGEVVPEVTDFNAVGVDTDAVQLNWILNENQNPVLLAYNTSDDFGLPNGEYFVGQEMPGGGTILFIGEAEAFLHDNLDFGTIYFYKIWSRSETGKYSDGISAETATLCPLIDELPFTEGFNDGEMPVCWEQLFVEGTLAWQTGLGNGSGMPLAAYEGSENAFIKATAAGDYGNITHLVTPTINFADLELGELSFFYANAANEELQDTLHVLYRLNPEADWILLASYFDDVSEWTQAVIELPELSASLQIAFEGKVTGGQGIALDLVKIAGYYDAEFPAPANLTATVSNESDAALLWEAPTLTEASATLQGYRIYRDGSPVASLFDAAQLSFIDPGLSVGTYVYEVTALYQDPSGESMPSNPADVTVEPAAIQYQLVIIIQGNGNTNPALGSHTYNEGSQVILSATAAPNNHFVQWIEDGELISDQEVFTITMNANRTITAVFDLNQYQVGLMSVPEGIGVQTGAGTYEHGQVASINTTQPYGYTFVHWKEGNTIYSTNPSFEAIITTDREFTAYFEVNQYEVTLAADPEEGGLVSGGGTFDFGTEITVTAEPAEGHDFGGWRVDGQLVSNQLSYTFTVEEDLDLVARFNIRTYQISLSITPQGSGVTTGAGTYPYGSTATVSSAIYAGFQFVGWQENGDIVSTNNPYSFEVFEDRSLKAVLESTAKTLVLAVDGMGTTYPGPGTYTHSLNATVGVTAVANAGWHFVEWNVNGTIITDREIDIVMTDDITATAFFLESVSTNDLTNEDGFRVYPQPARDQLIVEWSRQAGPAAIEIYNLGGQRILFVSEEAVQQGQHQTTLDVSALKKGFYLLRITSQGNAFVRKIVIQ